MATNLKYSGKEVPTELRDFLPKRKSTKVVSYPTHEAEPSTQIEQPASQEGLFERLMLPQYASQSPLPHSQGLALTPLLMRVDLAWQWHRVQPHFMAFFSLTLRSQTTLDRHQT